ncbi:hypothetical protein F5Y15DRAFT_402395 [Xylariaceae sp. FL0016]|nr:hypothetical protein F5Y15DRAFT_402395 [Xylariaceae sp. FL0016]
MVHDVSHSRRPSLEPIWTNHHEVGGMPKTAFQIAQSPLISPAHVSPRTSPSPMHPASYDKAMHRRDRALVDSPDGRNSLSSLSSQMHRSPSDGQSPLVSKVEYNSILPFEDLKSQHGLLSLPSPRLSPPNSPERLDWISVPPLFSPRPQHFHQHLDAWDQTYYSNRQTADAFVIARSLPEHANPLKGDDSSRLKVPNRHIIRTIIHPWQSGRQSFLIQRTFDTNQLMATVPDPLPWNYSPRQTSTFGERHARQPVHSNTPHPPPSSPRCRASSVRYGTTLSPSSLQLGCAQDLDYGRMVRAPEAIPIHLNYARATLPVLALLLMSGHVCKGDIMYLPVPHAGAWPATVWYAYTGQGELIEAVKENILYLGGKA